jgi:uncharacterized protein YqjF (DUF2071 family)
MCKNAMTAITDPYPTMPPDPVKKVISTQGWETLTFFHWRYPAEAVQRLLPAGLEVEQFDGSAWVGMVPFIMRRVTLGPISALPWLTTFPETNFRTYVRGTDGGAGVWFFSLDITRLAGVVVARSLFHVPYMWSDMKVAREDCRVRYSCRRRLSPVFHEAVVKVGEPMAADPLLAFLTNRWRGYTVTRRGVQVVPVAHEPWPLHEAEAVDVRQNLATAAGLPMPIDPPIAHFSPGVHARVGPLSHLARRDRVAK